MKETNKNMDMEKKMKMERDAEMNVETLLAHYGEDRQAYGGAVVPPIFQNSLFTFKDWDAIDKAFDDPVNNCIYTRGRNPSVAIAEEKIAALAGAERAKLFASGMGAISSAIMHCIEDHAHVVTVKNVYGPANNFFNVYLKNKMKVETTFVSGETVGEFEAALRPETKLIYLESPSSAVFSLQDLAGVANLARRRDIRTVIDNTWSTPLFQKPLSLGIDLEVHSCSKYLGGHSDIVAGVVCGAEADIREIFLNEHALFGAKMAPFEGWLLIRSLRTLPLRVARHQENALKVASFLEKHPKIKSVSYPGLPSHPQRALAAKQMTGFTGLFSFELASDRVPEIKAFMNTLTYFGIGVSWGGHESLIYAPAISYLKELPPERFKELGISLGNMRVSIGLENADDLIADLEKALAKING